MNGCNTSRLSSLNSGGASASHRSGMNSSGLVKLAVYRYAAWWKMLHRVYRDDENQQDAKVRYSYGNLPPLVPSSLQQNVRLC
jgi:hypothetical protein